MIRTRQQIKEIKLAELRREALELLHDLDNITMILKQKALKLSGSLLDELRKDGIAPELVDFLGNVTGDADLYVLLQTHRNAGLTAINQNLGRNLTVNDLRTTLE